jgi:hypothetical protein
MIPQGSRELGVSLRSEVLRVVLVPRFLMSTRAASAVTSMVSDIVPTARLTDTCELDPVTMVTLRFTVPNPCIEMLTV